MKKMALIAVAAGLLASPAQAQISLESMGEEMAILYFFSRLDADRNGNISAQEFAALHTAADTDKNGQVTLMEMMQQKEREKEVMARTVGLKQ